MRRSGFTWTQYVVVLTVLVVGPTLFFAFVTVTLQGRHQPSRRSMCQANLKQISLAIKQYIQDYDERYPPTSSGREGWVDIVQPYLKSYVLFQCPTVVSEAGSKRSDYFYNARLARVEEKNLSFISQTIMLGDGIDEGSSRGHLSALPDSWKKNAKSPARRHLDGANYAFADGHIKWLKPNAISEKKAGNNVVTFATK